LTEEDRTAGVLDASRPGAFEWKFFSVVAAPGGGIRFSWPADASPGFAVLHYQESLPSDVVRIAPGETKVLPLSGVSRIDWIVAGSGEAASSLAAPVTTSMVAEYPVSGLAARAVAEPGEGVSLEWNAARQQNLSGWAVLRSELGDSGTVVRSAPQWLPSQAGEQTQSLYSFVDATAAPGRYYRYDVWAVTDDGALSRSFQATIRAR
jgi:hypothetical protein